VNEVLKGMNRIRFYFHKCEDIRFKVIQSYSKIFNAIISVGTIKYTINAFLYYSSAFLKVLRITLSSTPAGTTIGLKDKEWGQIGVIIMAGTEGW